MLWSRLKSLLARVFRRGPAPGHWVEGSTSALAGIIGFRPFVWPSRDYRLYVPHAYRRAARMPLLVLLHGCRQTASELAQGTRITTLADAQGILVLMPQQADAANPYRCWNWFDRRTAGGKGEAAIVAKMIDSVAKRWYADPARVVVAGMSAGAALAAILGVRHHDIVRAVVTHSGIACGAAASPYTALSVMKRGAETDVAGIGRSARASAEVQVPLLAIHGSGDDVVSSRHAAALARQYLALNGVQVPEGAPTTLPPADAESRDASVIPYILHTREWRAGDRPIVRLVEIEAIGHAWSGGDETLPFNHAKSPDATALLGAWLAVLER